MTDATGGLPPGCGWCSDPLEGGADARSCAACGAAYHRDCASRAGRCSSEACDQHRPSHPAWTVEARAEGWLFVAAPPSSPWLRRLLLLAAAACAGAPDPEHLVNAGNELLLQTALDPWMVVSLAAGLTLAPWAALLTLTALENATHRGALLDAHGVLFDHSPTWRGARLAWDAVLGFRISGQGVRLVVRGRPWTRFVGPTIPCEGQLMHEVVETLERRGVQRFDA